MNNDTKNSKLVRFVQDETMSLAVFEFLRDVFLKGQSNDVYILAAEKIALNKLRDAWADLKRYATTTQDKSEKIKDYV